MDQRTSPFREIAPGARVAAPEAWVDVAPYTIPAAADPRFISNGLCVLLDDSQINLCDPERSWYYRRAEIVTAPAGAERAAQFNVSFDPAFETLDIHSIAVIRNGERTEHAGTAFFEVLRRERNLERLHFDGRVTLHVTLPDVRQGDVVETSYTTRGMRKSLGGRQSAFIGLEWSVGIVEVRLRQRAPSGRQIAELTYNNVPAATVTEHDGVIEKRWHIVERQGFKYEALTPPWTLQSATLQLTEWRDWAEVADVFTPLYEDVGELPPDLETEVARIAAAETTQAGRAGAILRFVQGAVRYMAISMGEGGYTPRSLNQIEETRYGDCKDKSKLYVQMARKLGIDACPALVNTRDGYALQDWLPSGQLFDHCIVRVAVDGAVYWVDPTRSVQQSPLKTLVQCYYGWALPLRAGQTTLERMIEPKVSHLTETYETITLGNGPDMPVRYGWKHTFREFRAEQVREQFARDGAVGVFKSYLDDLRREWPKAVEVKQEIIRDDIEANEVTIEEIYDIPDAWENVEGATWRFKTRDLMLVGILAKLDPGERKHAIFLGATGKRTRQIDLQTALDMSGGWSRKHEASTLSFNDEMTVISPRQIRVTQALQIDQLTLPAGEVEAYRKIQADAGASELVITETVSGGKFVGNQAAAEREIPPSIFWLAVFLCLGAAAVLFSGVLFR